MAVHGGVPASRRANREIFSLRMSAFERLLSVIESPYSYLRESTGLARAARQVWEPTVRAAMSRAAAAAAGKIAQPISTRKAKVAEPPRHGVVSEGPGDQVGQDDPPQELPG